MRVTFTTAENRLFPFTFEKLITCLLCGFAVGLEQLARKTDEHQNLLVSCAREILLSRNAGDRNSGCRRQGPRVWQLITGLCFLGGVVMMTRNGIVTGGTSAATVWMIAATGEITGLGLSHQAIIMTVLVFVILAGVDYMERKVLSLHKGAKAT
ncbi:MgtC/SapB family protein [Enterobacter kobei]|uniref:MgtC/SapB family protein n=1 Tax=Enterobacter kobei TaxID=208224 RepID=UPI00092CEE98|nr:MgtC/SapB family protein [Enterobacter kobei]